MTRTLLSSQIITLGKTIADLENKLDMYSTLNDDLIKKVSGLEADNRALDSNVKTLLQENNDMRADLALNTIVKIKQLKEENEKLKEGNENLRASRNRHSDAREQLILDIAGYKNRIDILEAENKHLYDLIHDQEEKIKQLKDENFKRAHKIINLEVEVAGHKEQIKQSYRDTLAADNFDVELDREFIDRLREYSDKGKGTYESKSLARRDMIFELAKGVKASTQDKNMIRLAKAIEYLNYKIARE